MSPMKRVLGSALLATFLAFPAGAVLTTGQIDTFEDGTTQGWSIGRSLPSSPVNIPTGGPAGADDNYLQLTAVGGGGPGSRISAFNRGQWAGNYLTAGINSITMDVRNAGPADITLRLLLADPVAGPPTNEAISSGVFLPAGGAWTPVTFAIDPANLTAEVGNAATALTNATELRLFHNPTATFPGPPVNVVIGIDNVRAAGTGGAIPEPTSMALLGIGLTALLARRHKSH